MGTDIFAGRYHILEKVGEGAAAEVYRAMDTRLGRLVAIKLLRENFSGDPGFSARFRNEARAVARLSHPNIVDVYDYDQAGDRCFIAMEFVRGGDLNGFIADRAPLSEGEVRWLGSQVLRGLAAAHAAGVVHRDVKPRNVLVAPDGTLKVSDFGVAKAAGDAGLTNTGVVFGTPHYLAPEVARGEPATAQSDLYAVGVMLYEMLAGRLPFEGEYAISVVHAHAFEEPPPLGELAPGVSPRMLAAVERAMEKDPDERFEDAGEMLDALATLERTGDRDSAAPSAPADVTAKIAAIPGLSRVESAGASTPPRPGVPERSNGLAAGHRRWVWLPLLLLGCLGVVGAAQLIPGGGTPILGGAPGVAVRTASPAPEVAVRGATPFPATAGVTATSRVTSAPADPSPTAATVPTDATAETAIPMDTSPPVDGGEILYVASLAGDGLDLRERPVEGARTLLVVPPGGQVRAADEPAVRLGGRALRKVTYDGRTGYVLDHLLLRNRKEALARSYTRNPSLRPGSGTSQGTMFRADLARTGVYDTPGVDQLTGLKWQFSAGGGVSRGVTVAQGVAYFGSVDTHFYAVDAETGVRRWRFKTGGIPSAPPAIAGELVYFGSDDGRVYAVRRDTGRLAWQFRTGSRVPSGPAVSGGVVYFGSWDTHLYAVDALSGRQLWRFKTDGRIASSPAIAGGTIYFGSDDTHLYAVDTGTRQLRWRFRTGQRVYSSPATDGRLVYVGSWDRHLYALDVESGGLRWSLRTGGKVSSSPAVAGGTVFFGSDDGSLYAADASTGVLGWNLRTGGRVSSSPAVAGETVYVGSDDSYLYAVGTATGRRRWRFETGDRVITSPTVADGVVYVGSLDGNLYALK